MQQKLLSVDMGNMNGVIQRELYSQDGIPDPGSMVKLAGWQKRWGAKLGSR